MLLFGHTGITLGIALFINDRLVKRNIFAPTTEQSDETGVTPVISSAFAPIDYRLVLLGSMLPDIIDKPLGIYLMGDTFNNGRIFGHTLLLTVILCAIGYFLYHRYKKWRVLVVSFSAGAHLIMDQMWLTLQTLLWPIYGWQFPEIDLTEWLTGLFEGLVNEPVIYLSEALGLAILGYFGLGLLRRRGLLNFLKFGVR